MTRLPIIIAIVLVQSVCALFFISDIVLTIFGARTAPISWQTRELLEIGAAIGLVLGVFLGWLSFRQSALRSRRAEERLRAASGAFRDVMEEHFTKWALTPAERDVALFAIKGFSTAEIASLRKTSEGTVKAQTAAIYRKAGVSGRPHLLSLFIDELMGDGLPGLGDMAQPSASGSSATGASTTP